MAKKRIVIVDYQLDNFHARVYLAALRGPLADRGFEFVGSTAWDAASSRKWASANSLEYFESVAELDKNVDFFVILAPANPELHFEMCQQVFPCGKPTFVDKTFAPSLDIARKIFALADAYNVPVQTTSALRSSTVQAEVANISEPLRSMFITAAGPTFDEYGIHPLELAISCMGAEVLAVIQLGAKDHPQIILQFSDNRTGILDFNSRAEIPFAATLVTDRTVKQVQINADQLFVNAAASILDFFDAGKAQIDRAESLVIRQLLDVLGNDSTRNQFIPINAQPDEPHRMRAPHWKLSAGEPVA